MNMKKFAKTVLKTMECTFYAFDNGAAALSNGYAAYLLPDVAPPQNDEQLRVLVDIPEDKWLDVDSGLLPGYRDGTAGFVNLSTITYGEEMLQPMKFTMLFRGVMESEKGRLVFFDEMLLSPLADDLKRKDAGIRYAARNLPSGESYIIVQDGLDRVLGAILPLKVNMKDICRDIAEFEAKYVAEMERRNIKAADDAELEGE